MASSKLRYNNVKAMSNVILLLLAYIFKTVLPLDEFKWKYINLHCRDDSNKPVDWWYIYKPPSQLYSTISKYGRNFIYVTSDMAGKWMLSPRFINGNSMLKNTLSPLYMRPYSDHLIKIIYDERNETEQDHGSSAKGIILSNELGGILLTHTVPGFPGLINDRFTFPEEELPKGHMFVCFSLENDALNKIVTALKQVVPRLRTVNIPKNLAKFLRSAYDFKTPQSGSFDVIQSIKETQFRVNSDSSDYNLKPILIVRQPGDSSCIYETFARKRSIFMDVYNHNNMHKSICTRKFGVRNIGSISMKLPEVVNYISNRTDRSGFAVSTAAHWQRLGNGDTMYWVCVHSHQEGTLKGGLAICVQDYILWINFDNLKIKEPDC